MLQPNARLELVAGPAAEPLSLAEAKQYLRLEVDADDELVEDLVAAARIACEAELDRTLITTTWRLVLDYLPMGGLSGLAGPLALGFAGGPTRRALDAGTIELPRPPLIAVSSVAWVDHDGAERSLDVDDLVVVAGTPGRVTAAYGRLFPAARPTIAAASVTFTAGYGPTAADVPKNIKAAIRLLVAHYYEHRSSPAEIPDAVRHLLAASAWGSYV